MYSTLWNRISIIRPYVMLRTTNSVNPRFHFIGLRQLSISPILGLNLKGKEKKRKKEKGQVKKKNNYPVLSGNIKI